MRRVVAGLLGLLVAWLGLAASPAAVAGPPLSACLAYHYDNARTCVSSFGTVLERGSPITYDPDIIPGAVDHWSRGTSARPDGRSSGSTTTYAAPATFVEAAHGTTRPGGQVELAGGDLSSLRRLSVAANSERLLAKADRIEQHLARPDFVHAPENDAMLARIRGAAADGTPLSAADRAFMRHELTESSLMDHGMGAPMAHRIAGWTHRTFGNYDPSVIKQFPDRFGLGWKNYWGIE
ncbi:hypothetical protein GCM10028801_45680 [Nocardioides maradonensis]